MSRMRAGAFPGRESLIRLMRDLRYGRVENLSVVEGDPDLSSGLSVVQEVKFGADNSRSDGDASAYTLKRQVVELFDYLDHLGTGTIRLLEVKGGLPFKIEAEKRL